MKIWAELHGSTVWALIETEDQFIPEGRHPVRYVEVTGYDPLPSAGSVFQEDQSFMKGDVPETSPPQIKPKLTKFEFMTQFTPEEWMTAKKDPDFEYFYDMLVLCGEVDMNLPIVASGLDAMVAKGHITDARKEQIIAAWKE